MKKLLASLAIAAACIAPAIAFQLPSATSTKGPLLTMPDGSVKFPGPLSNEPPLGKFNLDGTFSATANVNRTGDTMTGALNGSVPTPRCISIETGGGGTSLADNSQALRNTFALLPSTGGCIGLGQGVYRFTQKVTLTLPNGPFGFFVQGSAEALTTMQWGPTDGLEIAQTSQYNTSHVRDLSMTTTGAGTGEGLAFSTTADLGVLAISDVQNVTFKGADGGKKANYWKTGFRAHGTSYINFVSDSFIGGETGTSGTGDFLGTGAIVEGGSAANQYGIVYNFWGCNFQDLNEMFRYGYFIQGVTFDQTNFQNGGIAIDTGTSANGAVTGVLAELMITNSQFGNLSQGVLTQAASPGTIAQIGFANNLVFASANTTAINLANGYYFASFVGNFFSGQTTSNAIVLGTGNSSTANISGNSFSTFATAIFLQSNSSQVTVSGSNSYYSVTNPVTDQGIRNHVDLTANDGTRQIVDDVILRNHLSFAQSNKPTVSCAGASSASLDTYASDGAGQVNVIGTTTGCSITFAGTGNSNRASTGFVNSPRCVVSAMNTTLSGYQTNPTTLTVQPLSSASNPVFTYNCVGP